MRKRQAVLVIILIVAILVGGGVYGAMNYRQHVASIERTNKQQRQFNKRMEKKLAFTIAANYKDVKKITFTRVERSGDKGYYCVLNDEKLNEDHEFIFAVSSKGKYETHESPVEGKYAMEANTQKPVTPDMSKVKVIYELNDSVSRD